MLIAPLDGTIFPDVIRDFAFALLRERLVKDGWNVSEIKISIHQLIQASHEGRLLGVFGIGTAVIILV